MDFFGKIKKGFGKTRDKKKKDDTGSWAERDAKKDMHDNTARLFGADKSAEEIKKKSKKRERSFSEMINK